jgi:hypothetical protein
VKLGLRPVSERSLLPQAAFGSKISPALATSAPQANVTSTPESERSDSSKAVFDGGTGDAHSIHSTVHEPDPALGTRRDSVRSLLARCYGHVNEVVPGGFVVNSNSQIRLGLIHPDAPFKSYWDLWTWILILYSVLSVTLRIGFTAEPSRQWVWIDLAVDIFFFLDIIQVFNTAYWAETGELIVDRWKIIRQYVLTWFIFDLFSTVSILRLKWSHNQSHRAFLSAQIPFDYIAEANSRGSPELSSTKLLRACRLIRLVRVSRLLKITESFQKYEDRLNINPGLLRLFRVFMTMGFMAHFHACVFFFMGNDREGQSWIKDYCPPGTTSPMGPGECLDEMSLGQKYIASLYWSFVTMCTVGYGDIVPNAFRRKEMVWANVTQLIGATVFAYNISTMVDLIANLNPADKIRKEYMIALSDYLKSLSWGPKHAPRYKISQLISRHYTYNLSFKSVFQENEILADLPPFLRNQVRQCPIVL